MFDSLNLNQWEVGHWVKPECFSLVNQWKFTEKPVKILLILLSDTLLPDSNLERGGLILSLGAGPHQFSLQGLHQIGSDQTRHFGILFFAGGVSGLRDCVVSVDGWRWWRCIIRAKRGVITECHLPPSLVSGQCLSVSGKCFHSGQYSPQQEIRNDKTASRAMTVGCSCVHRTVAVDRVE